jgi:putative redox protein
MKIASVSWLDRMTFDGQVRGHHVLVDSPGDAGNDRGPSPVELVLIGLAGCTAMDVVSILQKKRQPFTDVVVRAEGQQADDHPHRYTSIRLVYEVTGTGVDRAAVERAVELSEQKYCSVSATLKLATDITTEIVLRDA